MTKNQKKSFHQPVPFSQPNLPHEEPLHLEEMLALIKFACERGYSIKNARDMKSLYDVISSDLYAVWFAIENEMSIFSHNIFNLIEFTGWERYEASGFGGDTPLDMAEAS